MPATVPQRGGPSGLKHRPGISGKTVLGGKRHRKIARDTIQGITRGDIRRLARRGGVKRIGTEIYSETRRALKARVQMILHDCVAYADHCQRKTITVGDVIFALKRLGQPIYGFDPDTHVQPAKKQVRSLPREDD